MLEAAFTCYSHHRDEDLGLPRFYGGGRVIVDIEDEFDVSIALPS